MTTPTGAVPMSKKAIGLVLIFCTAIIWILTSFISESLVSSSASGEAPKVPPFLLTWLATTLFTLYLPFIYIKQWIEDCWHPGGTAHKQTRYEAVPSAEASGQVGNFETPTEEPHAVSHHPQHHKTAGLDPDAHQQAMTAALWATPLWFMAQYTFNLSLSMTSVTSNTILSSTSSLFTFGLAVMLLGEKFTLRKLALIIATIIGTVLVTLSDVRSDSNSLGASPPPPPVLSLLPDASLDSTPFQAAAWEQGLPGAGHAAQRLLMTPFSSDMSHVGSRDTAMLDALATSHQAHASRGFEMVSMPVGLGPGVARLLAGLNTTATADPGLLSAAGGLQGQQQEPPASTSTKSPLLGDVLVLLSGCCYATYTVVMRFKMPGEEAGQQVAAFFGYIGLFTTIGLAPVVVLMLGLGTIDIAAIPRSAYLIILLEGLLDYVLSDYLWARAVMLVGPTVATLSLSVQIPLAGIMDLIVGEIPGWTHHGSTIALTLLGTALILAGFVGINLSSTTTPHGEGGSSSPHLNHSKRADADHRDAERGLLADRAHAGSSAAAATPHRGRGKGVGRDNKAGGGSGSVVAQSVMRLFGRETKDKVSGDDASPGAEPAVKMREGRSALVRASGGGSAV